MLIDAATAAAVDRIAERAADANAAFVPGALPRFGDVATAAPSSRFVLDPLSVAPPESAFFVLRDERGRTAYSQDGGFAIRDGALSTQLGRPVLGYASPRGTLQELRPDAVDLALGRVTDARVETDGTFAYARRIVDPISGAAENERVVVGRIALARFAAGTPIRSTSAGVTVPPECIPHVGVPEDGNFSAVTPMRRQSSRIDLDTSLDRLKDAYLALDAIAAAQRAQFSTGKTAMDLLK